MTLQRKIAAILILFIICIQTAFSHNYTNEKLRQIADKVGISADISKPSGYYVAGTYNSRPVCVGISSDHKVFHVGYKLFADDMKTQFPSDVYNFLERYLLELDCIGSEGILCQYLSDDGVSIVEGNLKNIRQINTSTPFKFTRTDNAYYDILWTHGSKSLLRMQFPINFELLLGVRKSEIELQIPNLLTSQSSDFQPAEKSPFVKIQSDGYYCSSPIYTYQLESLSTATFYERNDSNTFVPLYGDEQPEYSLRNLFRGLIENSYNLSITQNLYGYKQQSCSVSLVQWLNYCQSKGLRTYVGVSKEQGVDGSYKVFVIAQSKALAYNHLMTVIVPSDFLAQPESTLQATMNAFIPTHNIKNVYQETINK